MATKKQATPERVKTPQDLLTTACYEVIYCIRDLDTSPEVMAAAIRHAEGVVRMLKTMEAASNGTTTEGMDES